MDAENWILIAPKCGWKDLSDASVISKILWENLHEKDWYYVNLASNSSLWESKKDASMILIHYDKTQIIEFLVQVRIAENVVTSILANFNLIKNIT